MSSQSRLRVLVVEDHAVTRRGLSMIVEGYDSVSNVVDAADAKEAMAALHEFTADLVLLDINLPDINGISLLRELRMKHPRAKVLMLSSSRNINDIVRAFGAGAFGYCCKDANIDESLRRALRSVCAGQYWLDSSAARELGSARGGEQRLFNDRESALLDGIAAKQSDVAETANQKIMAGMVAKMRNLAA